MGAVGKVTMDPDGDHLWAVIRCDARGFDVTPSRFGNECVDSDLDPVIKFDLDGKVVESFGSGLFIWPHGIDVDPDGNVWVTDAVGSGNIPDGDQRGHLVYKFSPTGDVLLRLGTPGRAGSGRGAFNSPSDVVAADNGNVFIADGHNNNGNNRVMKFTSDGQYIMEWGQTGYAPGEFRALHAIDMDSRGRIFVGDRSNNRVQIFDQEGTHLATWTQFGRPSGIAFDTNGQIYVGRLGVGQRGESGLGDGDPDRISRDGLGDGLHRLPVGRPRGQTRKRGQSSSLWIATGTCTAVSPSRGTSRNTYGSGRRALHAQPPPLQEEGRDRTRMCCSSNEVRVAKPLGARVRPRGRSTDHLLLRPPGPRPGRGAG